MSEQARLQAFTAASVLLLFLVAVISRSLLLLVLALALLAVGFVVLPRYRVRGSLAAIVAAAMAALFAVALRVAGSP